MESISVSFPGGKRVDARMGAFVVATDQPVAHGGEERAPSPFSLFLASLATCAGFYVQAFCAARKISMRGVEVVLTSTLDEPSGDHAIRIQIALPADFPAKYREGVRIAAEGCKVKKLLASPPEVRVEVLRWDDAVAEPARAASASPAQA